MSGSTPRRFRSSLAVSSFPDDTEEGAPSRDQPEDALLVPQRLALPAAVFWTFLPTLLLAIDSKTNVLKDI